MTIDEDAVKHHEYYNFEKTGPMLSLRLTLMLLLIVHFVDHGFNGFKS